MFFPQGRASPVPQRRGLLPRTYAIREVAKLPRSPFSDQVLQPRLILS